VIGGALFLTACGMLAYGLGAILRHTAAAISAAIGLLFVLTVLVQFLPHSWQNSVDKWMPALAGSQVWATRATEGAHQFPAWGGFAVLAGWAVAALIAGLVLFRTRDA
jgi:ABC-2 type transport system permease protein